MLTNAYDAAGYPIALADDAGPAGAVIGFGFDATDRLTELTTPASQMIDLGYDPAGRVTGITFPNTVTSTLTYELVTGRLSQLTHAAGATPLADFTYGYDAIGSITSIDELTQTRDFTYDALRRLTAGGTAAAPESYAYDPEGNRTASHLSAGHVTDIANRLTEDDGFTYAYDLNGNLTSKTAKAGGAVTGYTYDAQDQLVQIDFPDLSVAEYRYDGLGRRIEKNVDGTITRYVYDGEDILLEFDGAGTLLARTSHGQGSDQPLAVERGGQSFFYHVDHQGSIRKITDSAGLVVNSYDYDAYGNIEASVEGVTNAFTYTGREFDAESGLYYYRARYYDPATGRFLQEDPIGFGAGDLNLYRYVFNDPVNFVDPSGRAVFLLPAIPVIVTALGETALVAKVAVEAALFGILLDKLFDIVRMSVADEPPDESKADEGAGVGASAGASGKSCPDGGDQSGGGDNGDGDGNENKPPEIFDPDSDIFEGTEARTEQADNLEDFRKLGGDISDIGEPRPDTFMQKVVEAIRAFFDPFTPFQP